MIMLDNTVYVFFFFFFQWQPRGVNTSANMPEARRFFIPWPLVAPANKVARCSYGFPVHWTPVRESALTIQFRLEQRCNTTHDSRFTRKIQKDRKEVMEEKENGKRVKYLALIRQEQPTYCGLIHVGTIIFFYVSY